MTRNMRVGVVLCEWAWLPVVILDHKQALIECTISSICFHMQVSWKMCVMSVRSTVE